MGRIAALLAYCYHLCRTYIHKNLTGYGLASFLSVVAGWLIRFLLKAKFYEWLQKQGGWVSRVSSGERFHWVLVNCISEPIKCTRNALSAESVEFQSGEGGWGGIDADCVLSFSRGSLQSRVGFRLC